jgi:cytochrome b
MRKSQWIQVWDPFIRVFHWALVLTFVIAHLTAETWESVHTFNGYIVLGLIGFRVLWGIVGPQNARFSDFIKPPSAVWAYTRRLLHREHGVAKGHNPLGGWMILALLVWMVMAACTGWLSIQPDFSDVEWIEEVHEFFGNTTIPLVALHIAGVLIGSLLERQNLIAAMWHGRKRNLSASISPHQADQG